MTEPKIRFQEYNAEWVEYQLEDILTENLDPVATPREGYRRVGIYCHAKGTFQEDVPADKVLDVDTMYKIHKDNLIVNITFAWEHAIAIVKPEDEGMLVSHRFPEYEFNKGHIPSFYKYLILRPYMKNQLSLASPGGAGRNRVLNKKQFMQIPVYVPCAAEQQKVADFLSNVDEVIAASEEEVANLEKQKKGMMQKIFSKEVRFKKEDGSDFPDWEEKKIGDILTLCHGKDYKHLMAGNIPVMGTGGIIAYVDKALCDWECVCIGRKGTIDKPIYMNVPFWSVDTLFYSKPKPDNLPKFQYFLFQNINWLFYNEASGVPSLSASTIEKIKVIIPSLPEQQKIADFLTSYDEAITAAKQELAKWKELKKGLLQQMFV